MDHKTCIRGRKKQKVKNMLLFWPILRHLGHSHGTDISLGVINHVDLSIWVPFPIISVDFVCPFFVVDAKSDSWQKYLHHKQIGHFFASSAHGKCFYISVRSEKKQPETPFKASSTRAQILRFPNANLRYFLMPEKSKFLKKFFNQFSKKTTP